MLTESFVQVFKIDFPIARESFQFIRLDRNFFLVAQSKETLFFALQLFNSKDSVIIYLSVFEEFSR